MHEHLLSYSSQFQFLVALFDFFIPVTHQRRRVNFGEEHFGVYLLHVFFFLYFACCVKDFLLFDAFEYFTPITIIEELSNSLHVHRVGKKLL